MSHLTQAEVNKFMNDGYITRQLNLDRADIDAAIDMSWRHVTQMNPHFDRADPTSWTGDVTDSCRVAAIPKRRGRVKLRQCVHDEPLLRRMIFENPEIDAVTHGLLGPQAVPRSKPRGLYPLFPSLKSSYNLPGGMDAHPFQVSCIIYLTDVTTEDNGPFNIWKGSHKIMHKAFPGRASWDMDREKCARLKELAEAMCERQPVFGTAGTAVFWHHRALHTPGTNRTTTVRQVVIGDFHQSGWDTRQDEPHGTDFWEGWALEEEFA